MIIVNIDVNDGLFNGTCGILKKIVLSKDDENIVDRLWFDFEADDVGATSRFANRLFHQSDAPVDQNWTCLERQQKTVRLLHINPNWSVERIHFPIVESEAITIHKSQGQTYEIIAFDLRFNGLHKAFIYVAWSRCPKLKQIYFYGANSVVERQEFLNWSSSEKKRRMEDDLKKDEAYQEMLRMRKECPMRNVFSFLETDKNIAMETYEYNNYNSFTIVYHNVAGLRPHYDYINSDVAFKNAHVLCLSECHTNPLRDSDLRKLKKHTLLRMSGSQGRPNAANGQALYVKDNAFDFVKDLGDNSSNGLYTQNDVLEIGAFQILIPDYGDVRILYLYNHPKNKKFLKEFESFLAKLKITKKTKMFVLGDFNEDARYEESVITLDRLWDKFGLFLISSKKRPTTIRGTAIDWILTNIRIEDLSFKTTIYESLFSDHKPLFLQIKIK